MILESLLSGLGGGVLRLVPEVLTQLDKKNERAHELAMFDRQIEADRDRSSERLEEAKTQGQITLDAAGLAALQTAIAAQAKPSGVRWIDGLSQSVRPVVTYWLLALYASAKTAAAVSLYLSGGDLLAAISTAYTDADLAMLSGILNFWFLDRVIRHRQGV